MTTTPETTQDDAKERVNIYIKENTVHRMRLHVAMNKKTVKSISALIDTAVLEHFDRLENEQNKDRVAQLRAALAEITDYAKANPSDDSTASKLAELASKAIAQDDALTVA